MSKKRVDVVAGTQLTTLSRNYISKLIEQGKITVNHKLTKPGFKLREGEWLEIDFEERDLSVIPDIDLPILYEDEDVIVVDKPAGVISHSRGRYWDEPSVASFIRSKISGLAGERAGIVHRLDRATSGVMICAKNEKAMKFLQKQFHDRKVVKTYLSIVEFAPGPEEAIIDAPIARNSKDPKRFTVSANGKPAQTHYKLIRKLPKGYLLELNPKTGRTHQLRLHLKYIGRPILGDSFYDGQEADRLYLHAHMLSIRLPNGKDITFESKIPETFNK